MTHNPITPIKKKTEIRWITPGVGWNLSQLSLPEGVQNSLPLPKNFPNYCPQPGLKSVWKCEDFSYQSVMLLKRRIVS